MKDIRKIWKLIVASFYAMEGQKLRLKNNQGKLRIGVTLLWGLVGLLLLVLAGSVVVALFLLCQSLQAIGVAMGAPYFMMSMVLGVSWLFSLLFGFIWIIQIFYRAKDLSFLVTMPISSRTLVLSRFAIVWVYEMLAHLVIMVPALVAFYAMQGVSFVSLLGGLLLLSLGLVPIISLSGFIAFGLSKIPKLVQSKIAFEIIGVLFAITISLAANLGMQRVMQLSADGALTAELQQSAMITSLGAIFNSMKNPLVWFAKTLDSFGMLLLVTAGNMLVGWGVLRLMAGKMISVIQLNQENSGHRASRKSISSQSTSGATAYTQKSLYASLVRKNIQVSLSEAVFFMQEVIMFLLLPIIFGVSLFSSGGLKDIGAIFTEAPELAPFICFVGVSFIVSFLTFSTSVAITKEGKSFNLSRMLPVDPYLQMKAYGIPYILLNTIYGLAWLIGFGLAFRLLSEMVVFMVALVTQNFFFGGLGLTFNLMFPTTDWVTPQQGIKRSKNAMFGSFFAVGWFMLLAAVFIGALFLDITGFSVAIGLIVLTSVAAWFLWGYVKKKSRVLFVSCET